MPFEGNMENCLADSLSLAYSVTSGHTGKRIFVKLLKMQEEESQIRISIEPCFTVHLSHIKQSRFFMHESYRYVMCNS